jgi:AmiR/NasT family two-component response regulator
VTSALVVEGTSSGPVDLVADLRAAGIHVLGAVGRDALVREVARLAPDLVVCQEAAPDDDLFDAFKRLAVAEPRPVVVFTQDPDAAKIERAVGSGIHSYVVNGYAPERLRSVIQVARARFAAEARLRGDFADLSRRFDERKLVDRAKGILMRAREVTEAEAFEVLRTASMHSNRRVGQVSRQVIAAAHYADAVNRAGKLRMLSQRLVKLYALRLLEPGAPRHAEQLAEAAARIEAALADLDRSLSRPTFGDLLQAVSDAWKPLEEGVAAPPTPGCVAELDALADNLLHQADRLTGQLETAGLVTTLHVINLSGRQRMLSQRHAKYALLGLVVPAGATAAAEAERMKAAAELGQAMAELKALPLSTPEIRGLLEEAEGHWAEVVRAARPARQGGGVRGLDAASEALLETFEQLTARYERSMQVLMG